MNEDDLLLVQEPDSEEMKHIKLQLLARLEKLLYSDWQDTDSIAFQRNFRTCTDLYERLDDDRKI